MAEMVNLYITMDTEDCNALKKRALELGFSSAQEYVRTWAKTEALEYQIYIERVVRKNKDPVKII